MHTAIPATLHPAKNSYVRKSIRCLFGILFVSALAASPLSTTTQQPARQSSPSHATQRKPVRAHRSPVKGPAPTLQAAPAPVAPSAPKPPDWPANDRPTEATVTWNSQGLSIQAANSSLSQILKDVATATGIRVEGQGSDQRIFGTYGPGPARDVLSQLLDGSGYNILMIGDKGQGTPRQIMLSPHPTGDAPQAANNQTSSNDQNADADEQPQPPQPQPQQQPPTIRNGFAPGAPPRTPQQIMQEMLQRQQQQLQQQNGNPPQ